MLIILNHKMNLNLDEIKEYEKILRDYNLVVMPQTPYMGIFTNGNYTLGSQCVSEYTATGGVSAESLVHLKVKYVLVGHIERRNILKDTDDIIRDKILECVNNDITPILCIGDNTEESNEELKLQIDNVLQNIDIDKKKIIIAYEPINNIGTDKHININKVNNKLISIKNYINNKYNTNNKILYGGSVNSNNINDLKELEVLDGVIVGAASLDINEVIKIYKNVNK